ncbi:hypothetical protein AB0C77_12600 [Streptomyces sp. NPDC048629]|uniref:helix-turn-helix transcriptional regulator n=1 Tax=Streptomyces sp. NPDC048629 TaxID=3154824 RepID=UPI00341E761F
MQIIDGRRYVTRNELMEITGYSRTMIADLWRDRETNRHPPAVKIDRVMHWDLEVWTEWFARHREQAVRVEETVDRSGDPDEELSPAAQARLLGVNPSRITQYAKNPPPGWPAPVRVEELPTRTREYRTRRQLWAFVDSSPGFGTRGGRSSWHDPKKHVTKLDTEARVQLAAQALEAMPDRTVGEVAAELARAHGQSPDTWKPIVRRARKDG